MSVTSIPGLILAAGRGVRFLGSGGGGSKVLSDLDGRPLIEHVIASAVEAGLRPLLVLVPEGLHIPGTGGTWPLESVINPDPDRGIGTSLAIGLTALARRVPEAPACAVLLGDQPGVDHRTIAAVLERWRQVGGPVRAQYDDGPGHPVVLPRGLWTALGAAGPSASGESSYGSARGSTDVGARGLLERHDVSQVRVSGPAPRDVDTLDDLLRLRGSGSHG